MNEQHLREIAIVAFRRYFSDVKIIGVEVQHGFHHLDIDRPVVEVTIRFDGSKYEKSYAEDLANVNSEILDRAWRKKKQEFGYPYVYFQPVVDSDSESLLARGGKQP